MYDTFVNVLGFTANTVIKVYFTIVTVYNMI